MFKTIVNILNTRSLYAILLIATLSSLASGILPEALVIWIPVWISTYLLGYWFGCLTIAIYSGSLVAWLTSSKFNPHFHQGNFFRLITSGEVVPRDLSLGDYLYVEHEPGKYQLYTPGPNPLVNRGRI